MCGGGSGSLNVSDDSLERIEDSPWGAWRFQGACPQPVKCRACEFQFCLDFAVILWEGSFTSSIDSDSF